MAVTHLVLLLGAIALCEADHPRILLKRTGDGYELAAPHLDNVCTSLDGPNCDPEKKSQILKEKRVRFEKHSIPPQINSFLSDAQKLLRDQTERQQKRSSVIGSEFEETLKNKSIEELNAIEEQLKTQLEAVKDAKEKAAGAPVRAMIVFPDGTMQEVDNLEGLHPLIGKLGKPVQLDGMDEGMSLVDFMQSLRGGDIGSEFKENDEDQAKLEKIIQEMLNSHVEESESDNDNDSDSDEDDEIEIDL